MSIIREDNYILWQKLYEAKNTSMMTKGKPKNLKEIEKILSEFTTPEGTVDIKRFFINRQANKDINKLFKEQFNYAGFYLDYGKTLSTINAWTYGSVSDPLAILKNPPIKGHGNIEKTSQGFRFKEKANIGYITITPPMLSILNPGEVVAILLHEIGHDFYQYDILGFILQLLHLPIVWLIKYLNLGVNYIINVGLWQTLFSSKVFGIIHSFFTKVALFFTRIGATLRIVDLFFAFSLFVTKLFNVIPLFKEFLEFTIGEGYNNEKFADRFAAMHGYAVDFASAENKTSKANLSFGGRNFSQFNKVIECVAYDVAMPFEEHPHSTTRINEMYKFCEEVQKRNPEFKKDCEKQKKEIKKLLDINAEIIGKEATKSGKNIDLKKESLLNFFAMSAEGESQRFADAAKVVKEDINLEWDSTLDIIFQEVLNEMGVKQINSHKFIFAGV